MTTLPAAWIMWAFLSAAHLQTPHHTPPIPLDVGKWIAVAIPQAESPAWYAANYDVDHEWMVSVLRGRVIARPRPSHANGRSSLPFRLPPSRDTLGECHVVRTDDGWLVGFDGGEFGGGLWWYSQDGRTRYSVSGDQVKVFIRTKAGLLAAEGSDHLSLSRGRLIRLRKQNGRWTSEEFVNLGHVPYATAVDPDGSVVVVTTRTLVRVHPNKKMDVLVSDGFWEAFYPTSLVRMPSGDIYIGMRHGVAHVQKTGPHYRVRWLVPNKAFANARPPE